LSSSSVSSAPIFSSRLSMRLYSFGVDGRSSQKFQSRRRRSVDSSVCVTMRRASSSQTFTHSAQALQVYGLMVIENRPPVPLPFFSFCVQ
jgi:hypothetical protein